LSGPRRLPSEHILKCAPRTITVDSRCNGRKLRMINGSARPEMSQTQSGGLRKGPVSPIQPARNRTTRLTRFAARRNVSERLSITTSATATAARSAAAAATRALAILSLVDFERASVEIGAIQRLHGAVRISVRHLHEPESARASRLTIRDQGDFLHGAMFRKQGRYPLVRGAEG
jgi:hypothetical protein